MNSQSSKLTINNIEQLTKLFNNDMLTYDDYMKYMDSRIFDSALAKEEQAMFHELIRLGFVNKQKEKESDGARLMKIRAEALKVKNVIKNGDFERLYQEMYPAIEQAAKELTLFRTRLFDSKENDIVRGLLKYLKMEKKIGNAEIEYYTGDKKCICIDFR